MHPGVPLRLEKFAALYRDQARLAMERAPQERALPDSVQWA